uniref:WW domain-containing protein n=1 Tax=Steinernema glaseri TaxID=37863 RepID=A0A1I7Y4E6_9BILA
MLVWYRPRRPRTTQWTRPEQAGDDLRAPRFSETIDEEARVASAPLACCTSVSRLAALYARLDRSRRNRLSVVAPADSFAAQSSGGISMRAVNRVSAFRWASDSRAILRPCPAAAAGAVAHTF